MRKPSKTKPSKVKTAKAKAPKGSRRPGRPSKKDSPALTRDIVLRAALKHVDRHGLRSLSIRKLAQELGVAPNTLYWYVKDKDELLRGIVELVFGALKVPERGQGEWRERVREVCGWFRRELLKHPNVVEAASFGITFPFVFTPLNVALGEILHDGGYRDRDLIQMLLAIFYHTLGFVALEVARERHGAPKTSDETLLRYAAYGPGIEDASEAASFFPIVRSMDMDALFELGLDGLLDGLSARKRPAADPPPRRRSK